MALIGNPNTPTSYIAAYQQACVGMLGIPAGGFVTEIEAFGATNAYSVDQLYSAMLNSSIGRGVFSPSLDNSGFATKLVSVIGGSLLTGTALTDAVAAVKAILDAGNSKATTARAVVDYISGLASTDATYGTLALQFDNRVTIADYYTFTSTSPSTTLTTLQSVLTGVKDTTVVTDPAAVLNANTTPGVSTGQTYTLTSAIDSITGTTGNDTIIGDNNTTGAGDQVNGGDGTDTLKLYTPAATNVPTMTSIENVFVSGASGNINLGANASLTGLTFEDVASRTFTVATAPTLTVQNSSSAASSSVLAGFTGTALTLTLDAAGNNTSTSLVVDNLDVQGTAMTSVAITSKNSSSATVGNNVLLKNTTGSVTSVTVAGDKALTLDLTSETTITSVVSSMTAGGISVNAQGLTLTTATGAAGNDSFLFGSTAVGNTVVAGGDGTDVVGTNAANTLGLFASNKITNAETVRVQDAFVVNTATAGYGNAFNLAKVAGATNVTFSGDVTTNGTAATKTLTISNMATGGTVTFAGDVAVAGTGAAEGLVVSVTDAGLSSTDVLNLALTKAGTAAVYGFTAQGVETLNIDSKNTGTTDFGGLTDAQLTTVKLTSSIANNGTAGVFTLDGTGTAFTSTIINSVDASGYNGAVTMTAMSNNLVASGATIKGGGGTLTATGTAGVDTVTAGSGGIAYTLAGGADAISLAASSSKADTITVAAGNSATTAFARVTGFTAAATNADTIDTATTTLLATVAAGTASGITNVTYGVNSAGVVTFAGSALASTSVSALIDACLSSSILNTDGGCVAFESGGNTYLIDGDGTAGTGANDIVIQLVGVTGITAVATTAAANTILIA